MRQTLNYLMVNNTYKYKIENLTDMCKNTTADNIKYHCFYFTNINGLDCGHNPKMATTTFNGVKIKYIKLDDIVYKLKQQDGRIFFGYNIDFNTIKLSIPEDLFVNIKQCIKLSPNN